jgi:hypothetical protein
LSSEVSSAHDAKQRHSHRFLTPGDPALTIGCVKAGEAINVVTSKTPFTQPDKDDPGSAPRSSASPPNLSALWGMMIR